MAPDASGEHENDHENDHETDHENDQADSLSSNNSPGRKAEAAGLDDTRGIKRRYSAGQIQQFLLNVLLTIPSICFITYGMIALKNNGRPINEDPIPTLRMVATYSPTVFPIAFAAAAANMLKAAAGWKMERGVTILSLEYLLSCRTVSSAITTPLSLRRANILAPFLIALWTLSPLGGQAAIRIMDVVPTQTSCPIECLEFLSIFPHSGGRSSAGKSLIPSIQVAFLSALASPEMVKAGPRDAFGNFKIPMLEHYPQMKSPNTSDWYDVNSTGTGTTWSAIMGIPVATQGGFSQAHNYSFVLKTAYMNADCSIQRGKSMTVANWIEFMNKTKEEGGYTTEKVLVIKPAEHHAIYSKKPMELLLTTYYGREELTTNTTCALRTTHAEVEVACQGSVCGARRIRRIEKPDNMTVTTVLDGLSLEGSEKFSPAGVLHAFMETFVRVALTMWDTETIGGAFPSPLETYFTHPNVPFSAPGVGAWDGIDISHVGDAVFSLRFSQLLNTFWLSSVASLNISGNFNFQTHRMLRDVENTIIQSIMGTKTPDHLVLRVSNLWISVLFLTSTVMLASGIAASVFGCLRRGPDVFDRATFFLRDNPHVNLAQQNSLEDGISQVKRTKSLRVCIGDIRPSAAYQSIKLKPRVEIS
ncbi:hypothetical protein GQ607_003176 [Colletotrichum asianum]|uniref:Uncharacterized protein n=1 Tax=Colletotrichum asianum TaxID=702518 RepID=A0A8H3WKC7_9PEZI|nr:hypothetical protein GQ607_003176 [Colletotrichum asianum]